MTTLILQLTPTMARRVARAVDILRLPTHEDFALKAVGQLLDQVVGKVRGRKRQSAAALASAKRRGGR